MKLHFNTLAYNAGKLWFVICSSCNIFNLPHDEQTISKHSLKSELNKPEGKGVAN